MLFATSIGWISRIAFSAASLTFIITLQGRSTAWFFVLLWGASPAICVNVRFAFGPLTQVFLNLVTVLFYLISYRIVNLLRLSCEEFGICWNYWIQAFQRRIWFSAECQMSYISVSLFSAERATFRVSQYWLKKDIYLWQKLVIKCTRIPKQKKPACLPFGNCS